MYDRKTLLRFWYLLVGILLAAVAFKMVFVGTFLEAAFWAPITEESLKFGYVVLSMAAVRKLGGLDGDWRKTAGAAFGMALFIGLVFGLGEHYTTYPNEHWFHLLLRLAAHPTYTASAVAVGLFAYRRGWTGNFVWGIAAGAAIHGFFNSSDHVGFTGVNQALVPLVVWSPLLLAMGRVSRWPEGPPRFIALLELPRIRKRRPSPGSAQ
ncbi:MAG: hypothetical protein QXO51_04180 [Halobacteria archaeon]